MKTVYFTQRRKAAKGNALDPFQARREVRK